VNEEVIFEGLNAAQRAAVAHGDSPLLIIAGAGTGKTKTLVHRVARLIYGGVDPSRILLMTFTRRAAAEMLRRVAGLIGQIERAASHPEDRPAAVDSGSSTDADRSVPAESSAGKSLVQRVWGGTFHAVAARLLRAHGPLIGLAPNFTIHDRGDSEDFMDVLRTELDLAKTDVRFPRKGTCMAIYSHCVNSQESLEKTLERHFPWCLEHAEPLKGLFKLYVQRKDQSSVLDYDDLLVFFHGLLADERAGPRIRERFECVLVDEYQDTNFLQAAILKLLKPDGRGLTVVGDDAQSIYSFRAASIRNILDFPQQYPGTVQVTLEQNYRSTQPILAATNQVIAGSQERYVKNLWSEQADGAKPQLVQCLDETEQADFVVTEILRQREMGLGLRNQSVLFRAAHHSVLLEAELTRRKIPFVKYGGLKFMETAHVKDLLAILRLVENPRDVISGSRALMLLPGIGPKNAQRLLQELHQGNGKFDVWQKQRVPDECRQVWPKFVTLLVRLEEADRTVLVPQMHAARLFYEPILERRYDNFAPRQRDLEQLEQVASRFDDRGTMLAEIALDPPASTQDYAQDPSLDDDYLVLSTLHSAKGLEWEAVYVIHAADGNIPSDLATGDAAEVEEERRLFYVGLTRAKNKLFVCHPLRYYQARRGPRMDRYGIAQLTRFLAPDILPLFSRRTGTSGPEEQESPATLESRRQQVRDVTRGLWN
jgi:DNA helicase-2/ATP-dependent DNA helicase PcrA